MITSDTYKLLTERDFNKEISKATILTNTPKWWVDNPKLWIPVMVYTAIGLAIENANNKLTLIQADKLWEGIELLDKNPLENNFIDWLTQCEILGLKPWESYTKQPAHIEKLLAGISNIRWHIIGMIHSNTGIEQNSEPRRLLDWLEELTTNSSKPI